MGKRTLGNSGIAIEPLALGGNVFGWSADESASFAVLDAFVGEGLQSHRHGRHLFAVGCRATSGGESETIIGRWLKRSGKRDQVVIATKVGQMVAAQGLVAGEHRRRRAMIRCAGSASIASMSTSRTRTIRRCRSRKRSARSRG